jgi:hypothetical protein
MFFRYFLNYSGWRSTKTWAPQCFQLFIRPRPMYRYKRKLPNDIFSRHFSRQHQSVPRATQCARAIRFLEWIVESIWKKYFIGRWAIVNETSSISKMQQRIMQGTIRYGVWHRESSSRDPWQTSELLSWLEWMRLRSSTGRSERKQPPTQSAFRIIHPLRNIYALLFFAPFFSPVAIFFFHWNEKILNKNINSYVYI